MSSLYSQIYGKYKKWIEKKEKTINRSKLNLFRAAIDTAIQIVCALDGIEDTEAFRSLYYITEQMESSVFTELYVNQIKLAISDKRQFIHGLYDFYVDTAKMIGSRQAREQFFHFLREIPSRISTYGSQMVLEKYFLLANEQLGYLGLNSNSLVCGLTTKGELMAVENPFSSFRSFLAETRRYPSDSLKICRKYGIVVESEEDFHCFGYTALTYVDQINGVRPFIDEYTYDILPDLKDVENWRRIRNPSLFKGQLTGGDLETITKGLDNHRRRTLPANGVLVCFSGTDESFPVRNVLLKEAIFLDEVTLLYNVKTRAGSAVGYYRPTERHIKILASRMMYKSQFIKFLGNVVLYLYASLVGPKRKQFKKEIYQHLRFFKVIDKDSDLNTELQYTVKFQSLGEERQVTYQAGGMKKPVSEERKDLYETGTAKIAPYVRHLPAGKMRSPAASAAAKRLGLDLRPNETFVTSHFKNVRRLKQDKSSKVEIASWI